MKKNIFVITNHYSYFNRELISGPKSFIKLLENLSLIDEVQIYINVVGSNKKIGKFPFQCKVIKQASIIQSFLYLKKIKRKGDETIIIFDRGNILKGLLLSKILGLKSCLRLLGRANRLNSNKVFGYANALKVVSFFLKIDLVIETIDGSAKSDKPVVNSHKYFKRLNGVTLVKYERNLKNTNLVVSTARFSPEKDIIAVVKTFNNMLKDNRGLKLNIFGVSLQQFREIDKTTPVLNCKFHGFIEPKFLEKYYKKSSFFISGNNLGILGNAELEAIQNGLPVINASKMEISGIAKEYRKFFLNAKSFTNYENFKKFEKNQLPDFNKVHNLDMELVLSLFQPKCNFARYNLKIR